MSRIHTFNSGRAVGLFIVLIGVLLLLDEFRVLHFGHFIGDWWPVILILIGFIKFGEGDRTSGMILIVLGGIFQLANLDVIFWGDIFDLWPVLLIIIGLSIAFGGRRIFGHSQANITENDFSVKAVLGATERHISSQSLEGGEIIALFGGTDVDLRESKPAEGCEIRVTAVFGGAEIRVPDSWQVVITGSPIAGAIEDKTRQNGDGPVVRLVCSAVFGGIEIGN